MRAAPIFRSSRSPLAVGVRSRKISRTELTNYIINKQTNSKIIITSTIHFFFKIELWIYLRFHIKHVFNSHAFSVSVPLSDQFVFGPGHVYPIWCGSCSFVIHCRMRRCVSVVDQLGLNGGRTDKKKGCCSFHNILVLFRFLLMKHWIST